MPIKDSDRIKDESTISRTMQQQIPVLNTGDDNLTVPFKFEINPNLTQFDTIDKSIIDKKQKTDVVVSILSMQRDATNGKYNILIEDFGTEIEEPRPTSNKGEYNKIRVHLDREGHVFLQDWTTDNRRTLLHHPTGSYFQWDDAGEHVFKATSNAFRFIQGDEHAVIDGDWNVQIGGTRRTQVKGDYNITINQNHDLSVGSNRGTNINASDFLQVGLDRISVIGRNDISDIQGFKEIDIQGAFVVSSLDQILLEAPTITLRASSIVLDGKASFVEKIGGKREISANALGLSSLNNISMSAGGNMGVSVVGALEETILGTSFPPKLDSRVTKVQLGNYLVDVLLGNLTLQNLLSKIKIGTAGDIELITPLGSMTINVAGIATLTSDVLVKLGDGVEPVLKGNTTIDWLSTHTHPTGVGPSGPPLEAATLIQNLSQKVFTE